MLHGFIQIQCSNFNILILIRYLSQLKSYVRNRAAQERSIAEGYFMEECLTFCAWNMEGVKIISNQSTRLFEKNLQGLCQACN